MGIVATALSSNADSAFVQRYVDPGVKREWAEIAPLTTVLRALKNKVVVDQLKVEWAERTIYPVQVGVVATVTPSQTTFAVSSGHGVRLRPSDVIFYASTGEKLKVTSISGDTLTVDRGYAGTTAGTIAAGASLVIMNAEQTEGGSPPDPRYNEADGKFNMIEIFEEMTDLSDADQVIARYALGTHPEEFKAEAYARLLTQIELALLLGDRVDTGTGINRVTKMGGVNYYVSSNVLNTTTLSWSNFLTYVTAPIKRGAKPQNLVLFAGDTIAGAIRTWVEGISGYEIQIQPTETILGSQIQQIAIPGYGVIDFVRHPLFGSAYANIPGWAFLVHIPDLKIAVLRGRDIQYIEVPRTEARRQKSKWSAYYSLICSNEYHHAVIKNVVGISTA